jgi:hypothetical protein
MQGPRRLQEHQTKGRAEASSLTASELYGETQRTPPLAQTSHLASKMQLLNNVTVVGTASKKFKELHIRSKCGYIYRSKCVSCFACSNRGQPHQLPHPPTYNPLPPQRLRLGTVNRCHQETGELQRSRCYYKDVVDPTHCLRPRAPAHGPTPRTAACAAISNAYCRGETSLPTRPSIEMRVVLSSASGIM